MFDGDTPRALADDELDEVEARVTAWASRLLEELDVVEAVERGEPGERRWYIRVRGEAKDVFSIWLTLRQRTLLAETYFIPAPEEDHARFYEYALRRNLELVGLAFAIGDEDAVYLRGHLPAEAVTDAELDRIFGTTYAVVERCFRSMLGIGFASLLKKRTGS
jgi:hypothetical protein